MAKDYDIKLKGYVGDEDFNIFAVDELLAEKKGEEVNVLIDSLGGATSVGMSISSAFRLHGNVTVHYTGMSASAATIASMGARHISIDTDALYLVHKCSMEFFKWGNLNADEFAEIITDCEKIKSGLDKVDLTVARQYAARCKRKPEELLDLMKKGEWLTAQEAKDWGFVDEVTDYEEDEAPEMTESVVTFMVEAGIPVPAIGSEILAKMEKKAGAKTLNKSKGKFSQLVDAIVGKISSLTDTSKNKLMEPETTPETVKPIESEATNAQVIEIAGKGAALDKEKADLQAQVEALKEEKATMAAELAELRSQLDATPAAETSAIVENAKSADTDIHESYQSVMDFCSVAAKASALFNSLP